MAHKIQIDDVVRDATPDEAAAIDAAHAAAAAAAGRSRRSRSTRKRTCKTCRTRANTRRNSGIGWRMNKNAQLQTADQTLKGAVLA
jgi:hypothetical protein